MTEIDRIAGVTTWAGNSVMDGGGSTSKTFSLQVGAATGTKNQIAVAIKDMSTNTTVANGGLGMTTTASAGNHGTGATGQMTVSSHTLTVVASQSVAAKYTNSVVTGDITASVTSNGTGGVKAVAADIVKQLNANANYIAAGVSAVDNEDGTFTVTDGTHKAHMLSKEGAMASITNIDAAMKSVSTQRSELGAISNRLSHTVSNMTNVSTNLSAARGGIEDADFALETTQLAKNQILQQASTAMLAQANASKQNVLSLLQN
jgi:flagellin